MLRMIRNILAVSLSVYLAGCGTDSSSGDHVSAGYGGSPTPGVTVTTSDGSSSNRAGFSLRLTDAPIDRLAKVVVQFIAVEMKRRRGGWTRYDLPAPQAIDLLSLQGLTTADLLVHMAIEPDDYNQIRFIVDDGPMANYVESKTGGIHNLNIPNGSTHGIRLNQKFTIPENRLVNFTVDFDLRKSVRFKKKSGEYKLNPRLRLVVDDHVGFIRASVDPSLLLAPSCSDSDIDTDNAVYVYAGHDVVPGDIDGDSSAEPITSTAIKYDGATGLYIFEAAFLPAGEYTIAVTCNANRDRVGDDDDDDDGDDDGGDGGDGGDDSNALQFFNIQNVTVLVTDTTFLKP